ncbi:hypothetical protein AJ79_03617 [Helicocarpus griseus UAMH5409]|uniref:Zn(2)-C6 fungal-type domain-containing protein n=1 Tax=Helicocarpus griseus UAMH5409 TaxID=1447875 RepID=A0A2B7XYD6_9EURO|nr:hypothetical protein AJ79_03617 [Helicocarpus griseus UAMH5409]
MSDASNEWQRLTIVKMASYENLNQNLAEKMRRPHRKSRNGCFECKRRRIKCDELKPSCTRCVLGLNKCIYPSTPAPATKLQKDEPLPSLPISSSRFLSPSPSTPPCSERSPSFGVSTRSSPESERGNSCLSHIDALKELSNTDLYHHYLQHTSRTLARCRRDQAAFQIGLPTLALQSKTVFHSLLAVSAACLGCDLISKDSPPDINAVNRILMTGYRHYNMASERMRESISQLDTLKVEHLLASTLLLVPFATSTQQINHWISERTGLQEAHKPLLTTPRDVIIMLRGIQSTLQTLGCDTSEPSYLFPQEIKLVDYHPSLIIETFTEPIPLRTSRTHAMAPIIAATSQKAFIDLQKRLESVYPDSNNDSNNNSEGPTSACSTAFRILNSIRINAFSAQNPTLSPLPCNPEEVPFEPESVSSSQVASWLRSFASRSVSPRPSEEPLTRFFLTFYVQSPQAYLDLVLPLLDRRLATPTDTPSDDIAANLTREQALALDIYAHWSVFMFLVEEESWWIGNLPIVTLAGMLNRYGDNFVNRLWSEGGTGKDKWWPASMLNILREIKQFR